MESTTFRITTIPNAYVNWIEKSTFGFSKKYSYDVIIRGENIEHGEKCDSRHYKRIKATAQILCLGSFRRIYVSTFRLYSSPKILSLLFLFKDTFLSENMGGDARNNLILKFLPASWNEGVTDKNGKWIKIKSITLRAESDFSKSATLEYEYSKANQVGIFKEYTKIETYEMDMLIRFARYGILVGMENRRPFGYIEFNNPNEILDRAEELDYLEILYEEPC